ncbi:MAG: glutamate synthase large subunit, partial [Candidatus Deferrimicrobiaceae bacterium]
MVNHTGFPRINAAGVAAPTGLYDPAYEHDSCGVGFVARITAEPDHSIVEHAVQILVNLEHRGAIGGDKATGDGAGLLLQIPDAFFRFGCRDLSFPLPPSGRYAAGLVFLPTDEDLAARCVNTFERVAAEEGCPVLGWRQVPVDADLLGDLARMTKPAIRQCFLSIGSIAEDTYERKLFVIRRLVEKEVRSWTDCDASQFYIPSLSSRTIVYKGLLTGSQLTTFYPDLRDPSFASAFAVVHQRYSTNTLPTWHLAHPFRFLAHNGEINTLRGNINRMRAREAVIESDLFGADLEKIKPVIIEEGSDSAIFDNALELLVMGGRSLPHAMMMMVPEAFGDKFHMSEDKRAFYEYHSSIMEPWDGPAALVFCDGRYIGATLDRNGLRPARYTVTRDGMIVMASETGVMDFPADRIFQKGRLQPGKMFLVDLEQRRIVPDNEIKSRISRQRPYRHWVKDNRIEMRGLFNPPEIPPEDPEVLVRKQIAFGYTEEDLKMVIAPMASQGQEAVGSMGDDSALAVLSNRPQLLFSYFKQLFAQVTNPPIDPLREELVMSLRSFVGREKNLLDESPEHCRMLRIPHPILTPEDMARLRNASHPEIVAREIDILFPAGGDGKALASALTSVFVLAEKYIKEGATFLILSDRNMGPALAPIPSLLATSGLHHHLIRRGLRTQAAIIIETGEAREVMHYALLIGYGANAICPHIAFSTVRNLAENGLLERPLLPGEAIDAYITAIKKGLLKTMSKMGISTLRSYIGAQIFEAVGLGRKLVDKYFCGTASRIGGIGPNEIAAETQERHRRAYEGDGIASRMLDPGGLFQVRVDGEKHLWNPEAIYKLQHAVRADSPKIFREYTRLIDDQSKEHATLRSLFQFRKGTPVPLEEVEPVEQITRRFTTAAMSYGSVSTEVHETIALAMNRLGGRSNCGEGGEDPARYIPLPNGDSLRSRTKQVASGRFGVTTEYLINADELQIKMAQGAKPGEGGQLPGHKVSAEIARVRHTTQGVTLISPPPHHDIYSIEDLAQLIYDLKSVNPRASVSVKLVSEVGVGTVAAGVAKAKADLVLVSGHDGGTGASPLTSIKHAGLPWELGLAETQQALINNRLRDRIRVQTDGQLKTGRDLAIAALMGAEEFGFGTTVLVTLGCVLMRKCHLNTCPVGVATQDPVLRARFTGKPEYVERFFRFIAQELRERMAQLGFRTVDEMVGRVD